MEANYRKEIIYKLIPYFIKDSRYHLLVGDMGFGAIDLLKEKYPERLVNCGIMEQGMVGIAAGMAMSGLIPIVYSIVNFLCFRALEQVRNDVVLQNLNVKFVGVGCNDYFSFLGKSHTCGQDDIEIFNLIGLEVFDSYKDIDFDSLINKWITSEKAGYIRV